MRESEKFYIIIPFILCLSTILYTVNSELALVNHFNIGSGISVYTDDSTIYLGIDNSIVVLEPKPYDDPEMRDLLYTRGPVLDIAKYEQFLFAAEEDSGLEIIDVSVDSQVSVINQIPADSSVLSVAIEGSYMFLGTAKGLEIWDISSPTLPTEITTYGTNLMIEELMVADSLALLAAADSGLIILDILDPEIPQQLALFQPGGTVTVVAISGSYVLAAADSIYVLDLSNPSDPTLVGVISTGIGWGWLTDMQIQDDLLVVIQNFHTPYEDYGGTASFFDFSDPSNPPETGTLSEYWNLFESCTIRDTTLFVASQKGLRLYYSGDTTRIGSFETSVEANWIEQAGGYILFGDSYEGFWIADYSELADPLIVDYFGDNVCFVHALTDNHLAVITFDFSDNLKIFDFSDPENLVELGHANFSGLPLGIDSRDTLLYISSHTGLHIFSIIDLTNPYLISSIDVGWSSDVVVDGNYAYIAAEYEGLKIVNVGDPHNPTLISTHDTPGYAINIDVEEGIVYLATRWASGLLIIDATNPPNPVNVGSYSSGSSVWDVKIEDSIAYITETCGGFSILDVSDPADPSLLHNYNVWDSESHPYGCPLEVTMDSVNVFVGAGWTGVYTFEFIPDSVGVQTGTSLLPDKFSLHQNYPNPFNAMTTIRFSIVETHGYTFLQVYDIT